MKRATGLLSLLLMAALTYAQPFRVETVKMRFETPAVDGSEEFYQNIEDNVADIGKAAAHAKTANHTKMWYYKGMTYLTLYLQGTQLQNETHPDALNIATEAFYNSIKTDAKGKYTEASESALLNCAIGHYNVGVAQYKEADYDGAIESYNKVLKIIPLDKEGSLKHSNIIKETLLQYSSYAAVANEDYVMAKKLIKELIDMNFADPNIYVEMVRIHLIEKDTNGALEYVALGKEMFENNITLIDVELDLYLKQGRSKELIDKLNAAIEQDPENKVYYFARAVSVMKMGDLDGAEADYLKVIELDPTFADAYYNLGVVYVDRCKPIAKEIDEIRDYKKQNELAAEIDEWYVKAAVQFEEAMAIGDYEKAEKIELAETLKKLYGRLMQNNPDGYEGKYADIKSLIASLK
jgi:tetratricopeptide (TPR) repeat protein